MFFLILFFVGKSVIELRPSQCFIFLPVTRKESVLLSFLGSRSFRFSVFITFFREKISNWCL